MLLFRLSVFLSAVPYAGSFSIDRQKLPGIWKLKSDSLPYEQDIRSKLKGIVDGKASQYEVLIKINPDGSFKQCNEGFNEGRWMVGQWEINEQEELMLALRRQYYGPQFDVLLQGKRDGSSSSHIIEGQVLKGKFMYQQTHPKFFECPMAKVEPLGIFTLEQSVSTSSITPVMANDTERRYRFEREDFYNLEFIMAFEPIESGSSRQESLNVPFDITAMPIRFFANNTFQANGINKILRGPFDVTKNDNLAFKVSRFGMGRSVAGSVYSEGLGLTHEDERSYVGVIEERNGRLRIQGIVTFGTDLGEDARPEPVGRFVLTESQVDRENRLFDVADDNYGFFE